MIQVYAVMVSEDKMSELRRAYYADRRGHLAFLTYLNMELGVTMRRNGAPDSNGEYIATFTDETDAIEFKLTHG
jgi:hypothetical protein